MVRPIVVVDTCCLINLCAIEAPLSLTLARLPLRMFVAAAVEREEISIRPSATAAKHERRRIDLGPNFDDGSLSRCGIESEQEQELYVRLATEADDGEAMSLAIAAMRGWDVATDDKLARRLAAEYGIRVLGTAELLQIWSTAHAASEASVAAAIDRIETLARYVPAADSAGYHWWQHARGIRD